MPYNPGISYHGDQYVAALGNKLGDLFSGAIDKTEELRKQGSLNDTIVNHALSNGLITQEEANNYTQAPWGKKQGIANGIMANVHDDWQRKQFEMQERDKAAQRALELQIAHMAHDPSPNAGQPIFGPAPQQDPAYADRGLDLSPTGAPIPTTGPQVGIYGEKGAPYFFPWREVTGVNPDGTIADGNVQVDNTTLPGSTIITKGGSKNLKIVPNVTAPLGSVMSGEGIPANTFAVGAGGKPLKLDKATTRRLNNAAATPAPTPAPGMVNRAFDYLESFLPPAATATPAPTVAPAPSAAPVVDPFAAQTPVPTVVAPTPAAQKVRVLNPDGKAFLIPSGRLQDYINAGWTAG